MKAKGPAQSALLMLDVIDILNRLNVPYAIIGAFAASFHGVVRASMDADALISLHSGKTGLKELTEELRKSGFKTTYRKGDLQDPIGAVLQVEDTFRNRVDLLMDMRKISDDIFSRIIQAEFMDTRICLIGMEDFIAMKIFAGSPKDLNDVVGVLKVSYKKIDGPLLKELVKKYGKGSLHKLESLSRECKP